MSFAPGPLSIEVGVYDPLLVSLLSEGLDLATPRSRTRVALLARLSQALVWKNEEERRLRLSEEALQEARAVGEAGLLAEALIAQHRVRGGPEHLRERLSIAAEIGELAIELRDPTLALMHRILRITGLLEQGEIPALDRELNHFSAEAEEWGFGHARWYVPLFEAMRALLEGRLREAATLAEAFRVQGLRADDHNAAQSYGAHRATQLWELGQPAEAARLIQHFKERYPGTRAWGCALAFCQFDAGDVEGARRSFDQVAHMNFNAVPRNEMWTLTLLTAAITCAWLNDRPRATRLYDLLLPGAEQFGVLGFGVISFGSLSHYLGMLAATLGRREAAGRHFATALRLNSAVGALPWVAHTHLERARCLASHGAGAESLAEARTAEGLAARLGLINVARKAGALAGSVLHTRRR